MSTVTEDADNVVTIVDIEPVICDLKSTVGIMSHLILSPLEVEKEEWHKVEDDLTALTDRIHEMWEKAYQQRNAECKALQEALAAAKAERGVPGSPEDVEAAKGLWSLMAASVRVVAERCAEAGHPVKLGPIAVPKPEPQPEPPPERLRW